MHLPSYLLILNKNSPANFSYIPIMIFSYFLYMYILIVLSIYCFEIHSGLIDIVIQIIIVYRKDLAEPLLYNFLGNSTLN